MAKEKTETKPRLLEAAQIAVLVDSGGVRDRDIKEFGKDLKRTKDSLLEHAEAAGYPGEALRLEGNVYQATVAFSADFFDVTEDAQEEIIGRIDGEIAEKLFPFSIQPAGFALIADDEAIKELKKSDPAIFKKLFKATKEIKTRSLDVAAARKLVASDPKESQEKIEAREALLPFATWQAKSITFERKG